MDLCRLSDAKLMLDISEAETKSDELLGLIISGVSAQIEAYCERSFEILNGTDSYYTEYHTVEPGQSLFFVKGYPISGLVSAKNSITWDWSGTTGISTEFINIEGEKGIVKIWTGYLMAGYNALQLIYTGGLAEDTEAVVADHASLSLAALQQVVAVYRNRTHFGLDAAVVGASSVTWSGVTLLDSVKELLGPYKRK